MSAATAKSTKKRSAASQAGPKSKKPHVEKDKTSETKAKKRSRPVTSALKDESAESSEDEFPEDAEEQEEVEDAEDAMDVTDSAKNPNGTPNSSWNALLC